MSVKMEVMNFIGGQSLPTDTHLKSINPATEEVIALIPDSGTDEVNMAVASAKEAFKSWSATPAESRARILHRIADLIQERLEEFATLESHDQGKPVSLSRAVDIPRAVWNFRFFADSILYQFEKSTFLDQAQALNYTSRTPLGVAGLITPWNLPLYLLTFKVAPCIAFGNTCVCKPSEFTSLTAWKLCQVCVDAGLPAGVVNMVFGTGLRAGMAIVDHPDVPLISFTGSTRVGKLIQTRTAEMHKKLSLELGGKNAAIVFPDADLDLAIPTCVRSSFINQGEVCLCTSRIFVHEKCYDEFLEKFITQARQYKVGDPDDPSSMMGAVISSDHREKVLGYIDIGAKEGTIRCGHGVDKLEVADKVKQGNFILPTVITDIKDTSRCMQEEIFGPVTCVVPFSSLDEVVDRANNVPYGLCASIFSKDVSRVHTVAKKLEVGTVWVNCWLLRDLKMPFGGVKASGLGREGFHESLDFYTEVKTICIKI